MSFCLSPFSCDQFFFYLVPDANIDYLLVLTSSITVPELFLAKSNYSEVVKFLSGYI